MSTKVVESEMALIGAVLAEPTMSMAICEKRGVQTDWFTDPIAKRVWPILTELWKDLGDFDGTLVLGKLNNDKKAAEWVLACINKGAFSSFTPRYIEDLAKAHATRLVMEALKRASLEAITNGGLAALDMVEGELAALRDVASSPYGGFKTASDFAQEIMDDVRLLHQKRVVEGDLKFYIGLRLPWEVLNACYTGVKPGIHVIAARPSQGKTALAVTMSVGMAYDGTRQLFFSRDMQLRQVIERYGAMRGQVSLAKLNFSSTMAEVEALERGLNLIQCAGSKDGSVVNNILFSEALHVNRIIGDIYRAVKYEKVKCIWIDYLQIIKGDKDYYHNHKEEIDDVLSKLKQCAIDLKVPIFCLAQFNRDCAKEPDRKPTLTDLGDSGCIEREASTILALWKDPGVSRQWEEQPPLHLAPGKTARIVEPMWLLVLKNQQGPTHECPFVLYRNTFTFRPANHEGRAIKEYDSNNRLKSVDNSPFFNCIRDDFIHLHGTNGEEGLDDYIASMGALGKRGL